MRDAYEKDGSSLVDNQERLIPLDTADVYRWLEDEGHFVRAAANAKGKVVGPNECPSTPLADAIPSTIAVKPCHICGLSHQISTASTVKQEAESQELRSKDACPVLPWHRTKMPILDVAQAMASVLDLRNPPCNLHPSLLSVPPIGASSRYRDLLRPRCLVASADPQLTLAVQRIVRFTEAASRNSADDHMGPAVSASWTRAEAEEQLAPFALLAHMMRPLVEELVGGAIHVAKLDEELVRETGQQVKGYPVRGQPRKIQVLTPSHVLRGLARTRSAAFLAFSRLGIETQDNDVNEERISG